MRMKILNYIAALAVAATPAQAEQGTIVGPLVGPKTMAEVMTVLNAAMLAIQSCNSGATAPANGVGAAATRHQCWADTSGNPTLFKRYDGASWVTFGALDTSSHVWTPYRNGAPIVAVATSGSAADLTTGTLPPARLPTPTGSTLGGVQSKTCSASQWFSEVTTGGVPNCSQPNFTDLTGTASLAQLPAFSGLSVAAAAADADSFPTNQGAGNLKQTLAAVKTWIKGWIAKADVGLGNVDNTSDATKWGATKALTNTTYNCGASGNVCTVRLASDITGFGTGIATALGVNVGSAGAPVLFNGAGGTPSSIVLTNATGTASGLTAGNVATNANMTGEVTSVGNATTVTNASVIGKLLTSFVSGAGTVSSSDSILTAIQKIVGNVALKADISSPTLTGSPRAPTAAPSNNSTQIATTAYVDAQVASGVAGVASLNGQTGALVSYFMPQHRITLTSGVALMKASVAAASIVFVTPAGGNMIPIYDGSNMVPTVFAETSQATSDTTKSPAAAVNNSNYDIFCYTVPTKSCSRGPAWSNDTTRGAGTALTLVNGVYLNNASITNGPAALRGTYVGTIRTNGTATVDFVYAGVQPGWQAGSFGVWSLNRIQHSTVAGNSASSWSYQPVSAGAWQSAGGTTNARVSMIRGLDIDPVSADYNALVLAGSSNSAVVGIGVNTTTAFTGSTGFSNDSAVQRSVRGKFGGTVGEGWRYVSAIETAGSNANASTFYGSLGTAIIQTGMEVSTWQ